MPFAYPPDAPLVRPIQESVIARRGQPAACVGAAHWMDTAILAGAAVEAAAFGRTGAGAHTAEEWVDLRSLEDTATILALTAATYCQ